MNFQVNDNKILRDFAPKVDKDEVFHTSGYAAAQSGANIGAGGDGISVEKRHEIENQRKFVRGYNNARIMNGVYGARRAQTTTPRTSGGRGAVAGGEKGSLDEARVAGYRGDVGKGARTTGLRGDNGVGARDFGLRADNGIGARTTGLISAPPKEAPRPHVQPRPVSRPTGH